MQVRLISYPLSFISFKKVNLSSKQLSILLTSNTSKFRISRFNPLSLSCGASSSTSKFMWCGLQRYLKNLPPHLFHLTLHIHCHGKALSILYNHSSSEPASSIKIGSYFFAFLLMFLSLNLMLYNTYRRELSRFCSRWFLFFECTYIKFIHENSIQCSNVSNNC